MIKITDSPHFYAIITILTWSPTFVMSRMLAPYFGPAELGAVRYAIAGTLLALILAVRKIKLPEARRLPLFALAGLLGFALYMIIFNKGTSMVTSATSSVIIAMAPVMTDVCASLIFREKLKAIQWLAVLIQFGGILILVLSGSSLTLNAGALWLGACALMLCAYNLLQRHLTKTYDSFLTSALCIISGGIELSWALPKGLSQFRAAPPKFKFFVLFLSIVSSALGYVLWTTAFSKAEKTSDVANYMFVTPFFAALMGFFLNGEVPTVTTLIGGLAILGGALLFRRNSQ